MFRKRRRPTPNFKIPPVYNPLTGVYSDLQDFGTADYGSVMQVAAEDTYDDYVVCRGFDPRIMKFIDYGNGGNGISVAKPFGMRGGAREFKIGELFPAFLPIQGVITYTSPSPASIQWRLGQNPGTTGSTENGGHPTDLDDPINILYDHNGVAVNWMLIASDPAKGNRIQGYLKALEIGTGYWEGRQKATIEVKVASCGAEDLIHTEVDVYDSSNEGDPNCVFDHPFADLEDVWVWATGDMTFEDPLYDPNPTAPNPDYDPECDPDHPDHDPDKVGCPDPPEPPTIPNPFYNPVQWVPCHFAADDRCCVPADSGPVITPIPLPGVGTVTSDYTLDALLDAGILVDATSGALIITLPEAASSTNVQFFIKKIDATGNTVTVDGNGADTIDGLATQVIASQYTTLTVYSNGTAWFIV